MSKKDSNPANEAETVDLKDLASTSQKSSAIRHNGLTQNYRFELALKVLRLCGMEKLFLLWR